jgi:hypothetical protein
VLLITILEKTVTRSWIQLETNQKHPRKPATMLIIEIKHPGVPAVACVAIAVEDVDAIVEVVLCRGVAVTAEGTDVEATDVIFAGIDVIMVGVVLMGVDTGEVITELVVSSTLDNELVPLALDEGHPEFTIAEMLKFVLVDCWILIVAPGLEVFSAEAFEKLFAVREDAVSVASGDSVSAAPKKAQYAAIASKVAAMIVNLVQSIRD